MNAPDADTSLWKQNLKTRSGRCFLNYARAPHCAQNEPWIGAPQALQKLRPVGGGGGIRGGAEATA